jgi:hypothetical protein
MPLISSCLEIFHSGEHNHLTDGLAINGIASARTAREKRKEREDRGADFHRVSWVELLPRCSLMIFWKQWTCLQQYILVC